MSWSKLNYQEWSTDPGESAPCRQRSPTEEALWEGLLWDSDHTSTIWSWDKLGPSQRTGLSKEGIPLNNGRSESTTNGVVRYTAREKRDQQKDPVPDSGFLKNHKGSVVSHNYKPNSKYGRFCRKPFSQSRNPSMKRSGGGGGRGYGDSIRLHGEPCPRLTGTGNPSGGRERPPSDFLDEPPYVREALLRGTYRPALHNDRDCIHDTRRLRFAEISRQELDLDDRPINTTSGLDYLDEELWLSGNSFANVTAWMIRNRDHLQSVLNNVAEKDLDEKDLDEKDLDEKDLNEKDLDEKYLDEEEDDDFKHLVGQQIRDNSSRLKHNETHHGPGLRFEEDTNSEFALSVFSTTTDSKLSSLIASDHPGSPSVAGAKRPGRICRDVVRNSFHRMRMEFRQRNGSTKSVPSCRRDRLGSFQSSTKGSERDSMKCYMEIVGSDISLQCRGTQTQDLGDTMSTQGLQVGFSHNSPLQSLSELSIIENMTDLLKDIEKSDLVLADHLGWLHHEQAGVDRWCVIADIIMCVFENKESNKPVLSILLPGADIYSCETAGLLSNGSSNRSQNCDNNFRITIDSNIAGQEHTFFARNVEDHVKWLNSLKMASNFDQESSSIGQDGSDLDKFPLNGNCFGTTEHFSVNPLLGTDTGLEMEMSLGSPDSLDSPVFSKTKHFPLDLQNSCSDLSLQSESSTTSKESGISMLDSSDFKKLLRRECQENVQSSPIKASSVHGTSFSLDRRHFHSMDSIDRIVLRKANSNPPSNESTTEEECTERMSGLAMDKRRPSSKKTVASRRPLSQSLDLSKITPITSGLVRKASGFKERVFGKRGKSSLPGITLGSLEDVKMSGFLQHKVLLKWQKLYFAVSRGCLYAFKTKSDCESPEFAVILSNYTITYLLSGRQKKHKTNKPYVFKLSQPNSKSIYLCAAHSLDLARWIQVMQMEANKVSVDNPDATHDSFDSDSWVTPGLFAKTNAKYALGSPSNELEPCEFLTLNSTVDPDKLSSTRLSDGLEVVSTEQGRVTVSHHASETCDSEIITAWDTSSSCTSVYSSTLESSSNASLDNAPRHDTSVTHVWQSDHQYRVNAIRKHAQKIKKTFSDRRKKWRSEEDIMIDIPITDDSSPKEAEDALEVQNEEFPDTKKLSPVSGGESSSTSVSPQVPKRHKPVCVKHLPVKQLGEPDFRGYLERRHQDGAWVRYWYCLKAGWLYCYLTPSDFVTVDVINLDRYAVSCHHERFQAKSFVLELFHKRYFPLFLAADSESSMAEWSLNIGEGIARTDRRSPPPSAAPTQDRVVTTVLSDDSSVPEDNVEITGNVDLPPPANHITHSAPSASDARQNLLEQVLKLKHDLEKKQSETRKKRGSSLQLRQSDHKAVDRKVQEEQLVQQITSLRQRRLSTQLKVDTLQRHMESRSLSTSRKKPLFRFGGKQKSPEANGNDNDDSPFMEEQMKELTSRLQLIDQDLTYREKDRQTLRPTWLDLANNNSGSPENQKRPGIFSGKSQKESRKRTQSLKLVSTGLSVAVENPKAEESSANQRLSLPVPQGDYGNRTPPTDSSLDTISLSLAKVNKGKGWFWRKRNGKESPQPETTNEMTESYLSVEAAEARPPSPRISPRREIDPQVLADIEEFEKMSRLALQKAQGSEAS